MYNNNYNNITETEVVKSLSVNLNQTMFTMYLLYKLHLTPDSNLIRSLHSAM